MTSKICFKCNQLKPLIEFYKHKQMADGHLNKCKDCTKKDNIKNRTERINYYREYDRSRSSLPHRVEARQQYKKTENYKEAISRASKRFAEKYPLKRKAHIIVGNFLRDGKLIRPVCCQTCGEEKPLQAHHCDYTKPLDVMWLCTNCHVDWHKHNTPIYSSISTKPAPAGYGVNYG